MSDKLSVGVKSMLSVELRARGLDHCKALRLVSNELEEESSSENDADNGVEDESYSEDEYDDDDEIGGDDETDSNSGSDLDDEMDDDEEDDDSDTGVGDSLPNNEDSNTDSKQLWQRDEYISESSEASDDDQEDYEMSLKDMEDCQSPEKHEISDMDTGYRELEHGMDVDGMESEGGEESDQDDVEESGLEDVEDFESEDVGTSNTDTARILSLEDLEAWATEMNNWMAERSSTSAAEEPMYDNATLAYIGLLALQQANLM